jgi:predicted glycosyl hydrolase (DUF1957 family)
MFDKNAQISSGTKNLNFCQTKHMSKIIWVNFLHFYQPPTADNLTVVEAAEKSYKRIIGALKRNPKIKFTINIAGCLLDRLTSLGYTELINDLKQLWLSGQIELTGSAAYHPILALIPEKEVIRQIEINEKILKNSFAENYHSQGFFIPEAAYSQKVAEIIKKLNFEWLLLDEISLASGLIQPDPAYSYIDRGSGLKIIFRQRENSKGYVPKKIFDLINGQKTETVITATDAELYGLRHADFSGTFEKLLKRPEIETLTLGEYLAGLKQQKKITLRPSSWESTDRELKNNLPYSLWQNKKNAIQTRLWQLAKLAIITVNKYPADRNYSWARHHLDKGLSSCAFWWASAHDFGLYGTISWNPDEIEKGAEELIRSLRALADPKTRKIKIQAEKIYLKIGQLTWEKHWHNYWEK